MKKLSTRRLDSIRLSRQLRAVSLTLAVAVGCASPYAAPAAATAAPAPNTEELPVVTDTTTAATRLVDVRALDSSIVVTLRYATPDNFTAAALPGYDANRAFLDRDAAAALARVQRNARAQGLTLHVFDAYRPVRATLAMVEWCHRTGQDSLLTAGYIASRSRHNLGAAIDLTLADASGQDLDMGTPFDTFGAPAHTANATGPVRERRERLVRLMQAEGFANYDQEWWHFSYPVAHPVRFDVPVR
jgi:D-alanyl-D-alanine dipeptidase